MPPSHAELDDLEQVYELNRLFLNYLKDQADQDRDCLGLPHRAIEILKRSEQYELDRLAEFPRALFSFKVADAKTTSSFAPDDSIRGQARQALQLTILVTLWNFCRRSSYCARAFFGLTGDMIKRLRDTSLSELPIFAARADALGCAFSDAEWLWERLLTETNADFRRELMLIALQPMSVTRQSHRRQSATRIA